MSTIYVNCADQTLKLTGTPVIAAGGINENDINFTFCDAWDGYAKTAVFWRTEDEPYLVVLDSTDTGLVPNEVLQSDGVVYFGVFGVNEAGARRTTEVIRYTIVKGAFTEGLDPADPTPDVYEQILLELAKAQAWWEQSKTDLEGLQADVKQLQTDLRNYSVPTLELIDAQRQHTTASVSLALTGWEEGTQTVAVAGMTAVDTVFISPAVASLDVYARSGVRCVAQADGALTFSYKWEPTDDVVVNVFILETREQQEVSE